jgi:thymidylate kinase
MKKPSKKHLANKCILKTEEPVHIQLDGPDGCGKSTQCKLLGKALGLPVLKMEKAKKAFKTGDIEIQSWKWNDALAKRHTESFIVDRGFTSSLVYSKVYKRKNSLNYIEYVKYYLRPLIIILTATHEELFRRRPVDAVITQVFRKEVKKEYELLAWRENYPIINTTGKTKDEIHQEILTEVIKRYEPTL